MLVVYKAFDEFSGVEYGVGLLGCTHNGFSKGNRCVEGRFSVGGVGG